MQIVNSDNVVVFMKGVPDAPQVRTRCKPDRGYRFAALSFSLAFGEWRHVPRHVPWHVPWHVPCVCCVCAHRVMCACVCVVRGPHLAAPGYLGFHRCRTRLRKPRGVPKHVVDPSTQLADSLLAVFFCLSLSAPRSVSPSLRLSVSPSLCCICLYVSRSVSLRLSAAPSARVDTHARTHARALSFCTTRTIPRAALPAAAALLVYPQCGFSRAVVLLMEMHGIDLETLKTINVLENDAIREGIKEYS